MGQKEYLLLSDNEEEPLKDVRVAVTGGAGFIGFHLCQKLSECGAYAKIYDNLSTSYSSKNAEDLAQKNLEFVLGNITNFKALEDSISDCEVIFHLAAQSNVSYSMIKRAEDVKESTLGALSVLEVARKADARVVFASTSAVYGNAEKTPTPENHPIRPISFYGLSKCTAEDCCQFYRSAYGLESVILRLFNVYGPRGHGVIPDFLTKLRKTPNELEILGTGEQSRDFVYISDVVGLLLQCAQSKKALGQVYNVGSGTTTPVTAIASMILDLLGLGGVKLTFKGGQAWEGDARVTHADISKVVKDLNWLPLVELSDGLKRVIRHEELST